MDSADSALKTFFVRLTSPEILAEVIAIVIASMIAVAGAQVVKEWHKRHAEPDATSSGAGRLFEAGVLVAPFFLALIVLAIVRWTLGTLDMHVSVVNIALQLTIALILVRLVVYALRIALGTESWVANWENRLTFVLWLFVSFELLGWFNVAESTLDKIDLVPGKTEFSLWTLLKGIVVVSAFVIVTSVFARTVESRIMKTEALAVSTRISISKFTYFFLVSVGILLGINAAGVDVTTLNVLTGAIGVGLGFGLQAVAGNFVSGFVLLMDKSIKPGDVISFTGHTGTSTENFGWVQELRGRYVVVRDRDGVETLVPNLNLITNPVINWSYSDQRVRLRLPVMVSYDDDPEEALNALLEATQNHPRILRDPGPVTRLMSFEDYGMRLEVRFWIADPMNGVNNVRSDVNRAIWRVFQERGIKIPVAQRELRMLQAPPGARRARNFARVTDPDASAPDDDPSDGRAL
ncbi:MAG TPA: mechanosensitive ion channel domain-containing protein [Steroidobacteraceae bacterium]|nr:mechanosensitive ion channel domain-containing protein [Steroidobacteraceae bacterium]